MEGFASPSPKTEIDVRAFDQYEAAGWQLVAAVYERVWSPMTSQAVDPLLDESFDAAVGNEWRHGESYVVAVPVKIASATKRS